MSPAPFVYPGAVGLEHALELLSEGGGSTGVTSTGSRGAISVTATPSGDGKRFVRPDTPDDVSRGLGAYGYLADEGLSTAVFLAMVLRRPLFLEGEPGGGKTEVANTLARWTGGELVRLQCYEGIDVSQAVYEWDFSRQLLHLRGRAAEFARRRSDRRRHRGGRAVLRAVPGPSPAPACHRRHPPDVTPPPVLIIDEVDRADDEFEAFLLEVLADYSITVPELGTFRAAGAAPRRADLEPNP